MIGERVYSDWHQVRGVLVRYAPESHAMCDCTVRQDSGEEVAVSSHMLRFELTSWTLPPRDEECARRRAAQVESLQAIRAAHLAEWQAGKRWRDGISFGQGMVGIMLDNALDELGGKR